MIERQRTKQTPRLQQSNPPQLTAHRCACGGTPGPDGECAACKAKRLGLAGGAAAQSAAVAATEGRPVAGGVPRHNFDKVTVGPPAAGQFRGAYGDGGAPAPAPAPAAPAPAPASGLGSGSISGGVTGIVMNVTGTYSPCSDCSDGLEAIQVFWGTRRTDGVQVGTHTTVFPPLAATYDSFVDGGRNSPGGATYSGNHPYYIGRPSLPPSYGYNPAQGSAGSVSGCTANVSDAPGAVRLHDEAYFETAFVCLNHAGSGRDRLLDAFQWGFTGRGATFKPSPYTTGTNIARLSTPSAKFLETLAADYPGYSPI